jgi:hypothetical protein
MQMRSAISLVIVWGTLGQLREAALSFRAQRPMCPDLIVTVGVTLQDLTKVCLTKDDEVIEALTPDRSDQPFSEAILPR